MITVLLVLMLMSALLVGFTTVVISDQRYRLIDKDRGQAFYAASAGIEKLTADLGNLFLVNVAPTQAQIQGLTDSAHRPSATDLPGITYTAANAPTALPASLVTAYFCKGGFTLNGIAIPAKTPALVGTNGYTIQFCGLNSNGNPTTSDVLLPIKTGPYEGLIALQTPYQLDVTAKTATGGEVHLSRTIEAVAIPVFQFGMFSDSDLSFFAEQDFGFGGRVHTNGNLWLAEGASKTLTMNGRTTAVGEVVRQFLSNGATTAEVGMTGTVSLATGANAPTGNRTLGDTEGSVTGMPGVGQTAYSGWSALVKGAAVPANPQTGGYNYYLRNGSTGAKALKLPLVANGVGGKNIDIIKRPLPTEDVNSILYGERLFNKASIRILLSDKATDLAPGNIPGLTSTAPILLEGDWKATPPAWYTGTVPVARSLGDGTTSATPASTLATTTAATALGATTIAVNAIPAMFNKPNVSIKNSLGTVLATCSGPWTAATAWTATTIGGCNVTVAVATGNTVYITGAGTGNMPQSTGGTAFKPTATIQGAVIIGNPKTVTIGSGTTTFPFAENTFFINDVGTGGTGISTPVTCAGVVTSGATQFVNCTGVPATVSGATITTGYATKMDTATLGGYIKIEVGKTDGSYVDITQEILNYGFADKDQPPTAGGVSGCADPTPNAIIRIQRLRNSNGSAACSVGDTTNSYEYWPNALFDSREGVQRDADPGTFAMITPFAPLGGGAIAAGMDRNKVGLQIGGVIYYIALDVKNLAKWFKASAAPYNVANTGLLAKIDNTGYTVYFSDRRNNRDLNDKETGEYGWEDLVNPTVASGAPDGACQAGEDVNDVVGCDLYGKVPNYNGTHAQVPPNSIAPLNDPTSTPTMLVKRAVAQVNRAIFFRHALKLINGGTINSDATVANRIGGLTVVSENPVYLQGDWNAASTFAVNDLHAATSIIADAVNILSNVWSDNASFFQPFEYNWYPSAFGAAGAGGGRLRSASSYYRVAVLGGKGPSFTKLTSNSVFGTDGGAHNFLRMLEQDSGAGVNTVNYRGSMATLAYNRQALGTFKCCSQTAADGIVYSVPTRNFIFDTDFLNPALLPPNTPVFRDINAVGFSQELRPGR